LEHISPNKVWIGGSGVENHQELVDLAERKLAFMPTLEETSSTREQSEWLGGENRVSSEGNTTDMALCFKGASWTDADMVALQVVATLVGNSNAFHLSIRQPSTLRSWKNVVSQAAFVDSFSSVNYHFSDSGVFGLRASGQTSHAPQMAELLCQELNSLATTPVSDAELEAAKTTLTLRVLKGLELQENRLAETMKNLKTFGKVMHPEYASMIANVTASDVQNAVNRCLTSKPSFIAQGGDVARIQSLETLEGMLR